MIKQHFQQQKIYNEALNHYFQSLRFKKTEYRKDNRIFYLMSQIYKNKNELNELMLKMMFLLEERRSDAWTLLRSFLKLLPDSKYGGEKASLRESMFRLNAKEAIATLQTIKNSWT